MLRLTVEIWGPGHGTKCQYCEKIFIRRKMLKLHESTHTGEKPFTCKMCNISFKNCRMLQKHEADHNGGKLFCSHGKKVFHCQYCTINFKK